MDFRQASLNKQAWRIRYLPRHERKSAARRLCSLLIALLNPASPLEARRAAAQRSPAGEHSPYLSKLTRPLPEKGTPPTF